MMPHKGVGWMVGLLVAMVGFAATASAPGGGSTCTADASNGWVCTFSCTGLESITLLVERTGPANPFVIAGGGDCGGADLLCASEGGDRCRDSALALTSGVGTCYGMEYAASATCSGE